LEALIIALFIFSVPASLNLITPFIPSKHMLKSTYKLKTQKGGTKYEIFY